MRRSMLLGPCALLAAVGCNNELPPAVEGPAATQAVATAANETAAATFVSLKVPNMH